MFVKTVVSFLVQRVLSGSEKNQFHSLAELYFQFDSAIFHS